MTATLVNQQTADLSSVSSGSIFYSPTPGNALLLFISRGGGATGIPTVTDDAGQTWTAITGDVSGATNTQISLFYILDTAAITTISFSSSAAQDTSYNLTEWSGLASSDGSVTGGNSTTSTTFDTPGLLTTNPTDLVVGAMTAGLQSGGTTLTTAGATDLTAFDSGTNSGRAAYQVVSATGTYSFEWTGSTKRKAGFLTAAFTEAATGPPHGSATGTVSLTGSATGHTLHAGSATGTGTATGSATGSALHDGSATGSVSITGSATGHTPPNNGSATGSVSITGSATGHTSHEGSATGSVSATGSATGHTAHEGSATGSVSASGSATGSALHEGSATGSVSITGSASGTLVPHGTATGSVSATGSASGHTPAVGGMEGSATGSVSITGSASGHLPATGSATGLCSITGSASGTRDMHGSAAGGVNATGSASGHAPSIAGSQGSATGSVSITGSATGHKVSRGSSVGRVSATGSASGHRVSRGSAAGLCSITGYGTAHTSVYQHRLVKTIDTSRREMGWTEHDRSRVIGDTSRTGSVDETGRTIETVEHTRTVSVEEVSTS